MRIEGNLIIRWHEQGFEVRFVPARAGGGGPTPLLRLPDPPALATLLTRLGLDRDRVVRVLSSPYVLHSLRLRVEPRAARRAGLLLTPTWRALAALIGTLRSSVRVVSRLRSRP